MGPVGGVSGIEAIHAAIGSAGFECVGSCATGALVLRPEVRAMCAAGRCRAYGANWACPPHCGSLEDFRCLLDGHRECILVQTVAPLEDEFDADAMLVAESLHRRRMAMLAEALGSQEDTAVLGAGPCTLCDPCPCPDESCRFPHRRLVSMEAAGLVVSEACTAAGIAYNHGPCTIAYTGCVLAGKAPP